MPRPGGCKLSCQSSGDPEWDMKVESWNAVTTAFWLLINCFYMTPALPCSLTTYEGCLLKLNQRRYLLYLASVVKGAGCTGEMWKCGILTGIQTTFNQSVYFRILSLQKSISLSLPIYISYWFGFSREPWLIYSFLPGLERETW